MCSGNGGPLYRCLLDDQCSRAILLRSQAKVSLKNAMTEQAAFLTPAILFVATLIRSAFGFGEALVAVPLLALLMPVEVAAPVTVLVSITVAFIVVVQDWRKVHVRSAFGLVLSTLFGLPLGLLLLRAVSAPVV